MSKYWLIIFIVTIVIITCLYIILKSTPSTTTTLNIKNNLFNLEVAKTIQQHSLGLMNRQSLCPNCGMIFVFGLELPQSFWMKNTYVPLDIIFVDKSGKIINISQGIPQSTELIPSLRPAKYVIELNAGTSQKINLNAGDTIDLSNLLKSLIK